MSNDQVKKLMNIPKRHTLKHYMELLGQLYGEPKETLDVYVEEQLIKHEDNLDAAIECFKNQIPDPISVEHRVEANYPLASKTKPWIEDRKRKIGDV